MFYFLACSGDTVFSAFTTGAFLDWLFRQQARELSLDQDMDIQYLLDFPIEKLRLRLLISELAVDGMSIVCANSLFKKSILTNVGCYVWLVELLKYKYPIIFV